MRRSLQALLLACTFAGVLACAHTDDAGAPARQAVIEANLLELQDCWTDLASDHPGASGSMLFTVDLRRDGSVEWVDIAVDELQIPKLGACTVKRIKRWQFPPDPRRRTVSFGVGFTAP